MSTAYPIKVVHLVRALDVGGLEGVVLDLVRHRTRDLIEVEIVCLEQRGALAERFEEAGAPVRALGLVNVSFARRAWTLSRVLARLRPDVVHTHNAAPHVNGSIAATLARIPVLVHTKHGRNYVHDRKKLFQNRIASRLTSRVVCVSNDAAEVARRLERVSDRRLAVIHNGIDLGRFRVNPRPCTSADRIRAIHVARLNRVKDQVTLLHAVRRVVDRFPGFHLDVIGDGPAGVEVRQLSRDLSLGAHVTFHGMCEDIPEFLVSADLFILSSISEGISLTLLEAMAAGLPIVATDVGGNGEVVQSDMTGLLVPPRDPAAMSEAILKISRDGRLARAMGERGRQRAEEFFSVESMVTAYEKLYCKILQRAPLPRQIRIGPTETRPELVAPTRN